MKYIYLADAICPFSNLAHLLAFCAHFHLSAGICHFARLTAHFWATAINNN